MADENTVGGVNVEVGVDTTKLNAGLDQAKAKTESAASQMTAAWSRLSEAQQRAVAQMMQSSKSLAEAEEQVLKRWTTAENQLKVLTALREKAAQAGIAEGAALNSLTQKVNENTRANVTNTASNINGVAALEATVLVHEALAGRFSRMVPTTLILGQALAGNAATANFLKAVMSPLGLAITGVTAAMVAGVVAAMQYEEAQRKLAVAAAGAGSVSGQTRDGLEQIARANVTASASISQNRMAVAELSKADIENRSTLSALTGTVDTYAQVTGEKATEAAKQLATAFKDPAKGAADLNEQFHFLSGAEQDQIEELERLGERTKAQDELQQLLTKHMEEAKDAAGNLTTGFGLLGAAAHDTADQVGWLADKIIKLDAASGMFGAKAQAQAAAALGYKDAAQAAIDTQEQLNKITTRGFELAGETPEGKAKVQVEELAGKVNDLTAALGASAQQYGINADGTKRLYAAQQDTIRAYTSLRDMNERATKAGVSLETEREHEIAAAQAAYDRAGSHDAVARAAAARAMEEAKSAGVIESAADAQARANDKASIATAKAEHATAGHADALGEETAKLTANTSALLAEADAYSKADAAQAERLEAQRKAADFAAGHPKDRVNIDALGGLYLAEDVAKAADAAAKRAQALSTETDIRRQLNDQVQEGSISVEAANRAATQEIQLTALMAAETNATGDAKARLVDIEHQWRQAMTDSNAELARQTVLAATAADNERRHVAEAETAGLQQSNRQRLVSEAVTKAQAEIQKAGLDPMSSTGVDRMSAAARAANAQANLANATYVHKATDEVQAQIGAMKEQQAVYGMTGRAAAAYQEQQKLILDAVKQGLDLDEAQIAKLKELGTAYADAAAQAKQFKDAESAAHGVTEDLASAIESVADHSKTGRQALNDLKKSLMDQFTKGMLTGEGPMGGMLGGPTGKGVMGLVEQPLTGLFQKLGMGGIMGGKKGDSPMNPLYVALSGSGPSGGNLGSGGVGGIGNAIGGFLGKIFGGGGGVGSFGLPNAFTSAAATGYAGVTMPAFMMHGGGTVGGGGVPIVQAPASLFLQAPRYHNGLGPDEHAAILQHGETVTPRGGGMRGDQKVTINLAGANGDAAIRRISAQGVARGMQLMRDSSPGERAQYKLLEA